MTMIGLDSKIYRNPEVVFTQIDNDLVMIGPEDKSFYGVNALGAEIWSLLEVAELSLNEICQRIQEKYDVTETQCLEDVEKFVNLMLAQNFVSITNL